MRGMSFGSYNKRYSLGAEWEKLRSQSPLPAFFLHVEEKLACNEKPAVETGSEADSVRNTYLCGQLIVQVSCLLTGSCQFYLQLWVYGHWRKRYNSDMNIHSIHIHV